jgi:hypothetical protein
MEDVPRKNQRFLEKLQALDQKFEVMKKNPAFLQSEGMTKESIEEAQQVNKKLMEFYE